MPKVGYAVDLESSQVTPAWVQSKINNAKAVMQGRLDDENIIDFKNIHKSVKDFPSEVVAYDNCMKYFSSDTDNPYDNLFAELVRMCKASPDVAVVGGTFDSEMSETFTIEENVANNEDSGSGATSETRIMKKEMEIPPNYYPMTWGELADHMVASGFIPQTIAIDQNTGELSLTDTTEVNESSTDEEKKNYILKEFNLDSNNYVETMGYFRDGDSAKVNVNAIDASDDVNDVWGEDVNEAVIQVYLSEVSNEFVEAKNVFSVNCTAEFDVNFYRVEPSDKPENFKYLNDSGFATVKLIPEILCKVI